MRRLAYPATVLLLLATASSAYAGAGLPKLASLKAGGYSVGVHLDSLVPHVGTNVLTIEAANLPHGSQIELTLVGPQGQTVDVPMNPLTVLTGPAGDAHGAAEDSHGAAADGHGTAASDHGAATGNHGAAPDNRATEAQTADHASESVALNARGKVKLDQIGDWKAVLTIHDTPEGDLKAEAPFTVEQGGPSRPYLAFTGLLMGGTAIYAAINRRKGAHTGR